MIFCVLKLIQSLIVFITISKILMRLNVVVVIVVVVFGKFTAAECSYDVSIFRETFAFVNGEHSPRR